MALIPFGSLIILLAGICLSDKYAATVPIPWPTAKQVAITLVDAKAICVAEIFLPANIKLSGNSATQDLSGIS